MGVGPAGCGLPGTEVAGEKSLLTAPVGRQWLSLVRSLRWHKPAEQLGRSEHYAGMENTGDGRYAWEPFFWWFFKALLDQRVRGRCKKRVFPGFGAGALGAWKVDSDWSEFTAV